MRYSVAIIKFGCLCSLGVNFSENGTDIDKIDATEFLVAGLAGKHIIEKLKN